MRWINVRWRPAMSCTNPLVLAPDLGGGRHGCGAKGDTFGVLYFSLKGVGGWVSTHLNNMNETNWIIEPKGLGWTLKNDWNHHLDFVLNTWCFWFFASNTRDLIKFRTLLVVSIHPKRNWKENNNEKRGVFSHSTGHISWKRLEIACRRLAASRKEVNPQKQSVKVIRM